MIKAVSVKQRTNGPQGWHQPGHQQREQERKQLLLLVAGVSCPGVMSPPSLPNSRGPSDLCVKEQHSKHHEAASSINHGGHMHGSEHKEVDRWLVARF